MGGAVAVTVRFSEKEQYRMDWGTRGINLFKHPGFLMQDPEHLDACRARWVNPEFAGSLSPSGYGLVVVDLVTKRIISFQNFTSVDTVHLVMSAQDPELAEEVKTLAENGFISQVVAWRREEGGDLTRLVVPLSDYGQIPGEAVVKAQELFDANFAKWEESGVGEVIPHELMVDTKFAVLSANASPREVDWPMVRRTLVDEMGFVLTESENKEWEQWIKDTTETTPEE
jgi:hypothetical protein